jgi:hypothetical protein
MAKKIPKKLEVELIPKTCWWSSVRTMVKPSEWNKIRFISYEKANNICEICSDNGLNQGYKHPVECHEIWHYDDKNKIQKLIGLITLCPLCHLVKHIGRANAMGKQPEVFKQLEKINKWNHKQVVEHVANSFELYKERSKYQWTLDLSILNQPPYELNVKTKTRKFKKTFKKKPRRKR